VPFVLYRCNAFEACSLIQTLGKISAPKGVASSLFPIQGNNKKNIKKILKK